MIRLGAIRQTSAIGCRGTVMYQKSILKRIFSFNEKGFYLSLRDYRVSDFSVGCEIQSISENRALFSSLYSRFPLNAVSDLNYFYYYLLTRKLSRMQDLARSVQFLEPADYDLLLKLSEDAGNALRKVNGSAVKYLNTHKGKIFSRKQLDYELKDASVDFMLEFSKVIDDSVFEYLCRNCGYLIVNRFGDFRKVFKKNSSLFPLLFKSGRLKDLNSLGLQNVLDIWGHEYSIENSPFREKIAQYVCELCDDAEALCQKLSEENVIYRESDIRAVSSFLQAIKSPKANEFSEYVKKTEDLKRKYFESRALLCVCPLPVPDIERWKADSSELKLLELTHRQNQESKKYESLLSKKTNGPSILDYAVTDIPSDSLFTPDFQHDLTILESVRAAVFLEILSDPAAFDAYSRLVISSVKLISEKMSLPGNELENDTGLLLFMLGTVAGNIKLHSQEQKASCYSASMFLCSSAEKLLRLFYQHLAKDRQYIPEDVTLGELLRTDRVELADVFGSLHIQCLAYFLIRTPDTKIGRNYRNNLAHWTSGMTPDQMTPGFTSGIMWLFTDVLNSVFLYFYGQNIVADEAGS